eukprot:TRINITY_DN25979_c0_g1_i1.p1 TRINITY_DN25979_c0_g1~~TRINITY_DN25979_c0_g1_i1.p1  ORF type:complete len:354 (+),score=54.45 TRINITY_DN25979_c0_g1_i1:57-1064(+)
MTHDLVHSGNCYVPPMNELASVLRSALEDNFGYVECSAGPCPDLRQFGLVASGLGGKAEYVECGTILGSMFQPAKQRDVFTIPETGKAFGRSDAFVIGSAAGSVSECGVNSEWTGNALLKSSKVVANQSKVAYISNMAKLPETVEVRTSDEKGEFGCIGNLLFTSGEAGSEVIRVKVTRRKAEKNWSEDPHDQELIRIMRTALDKAYPGVSEHVCLGGVMVVVKGKTVTHVMPPYFPPPGSKPGKSFPDMNGWSERFFYSTNKLIAATTFMNHQGTGLPDGLKWRLDHTHFYTQDGKEAGHYHYDVTPDIIAYEAYLVPASMAHKIELNHKRSKL